MTLMEALIQADLLRPNELDPSLKLRWLSTLDGQIYTELLQPHGDGPETFSGYGEDTELQSTQLLVPWPYDELYLRYLVMRLDLEHGELDRYNNSAAAFNRLWQSWAGHYARNHRLSGVTGLKF